MRNSPTHFELNNSAFNGVISSVQEKLKQQNELNHNGSDDVIPGASRK